jgi:hypothetical protein
MAESEDSNDNNIKKINIIIKTAKEKETIEVNENQSVKEVWPTFQSFNIIANFYTSFLISITSINIF